MAQYANNSSIIRSIMFKETSTMKKSIGSLALLFFLFGCGQSDSTNNTQSTKSTKESSQDTSKTTLNKDNLSEGTNEAENSPTMTFEELYPKLKKSLIKSTCEPCKTKEGKNTLTANSKESDMFLSTWTWDPKTLKAKDIDDDGLMDYTIELSNGGGGCGGQVGIEERWTLFGSNPNKFVLTHIIPYRSPSRKWQKAY